MRHWKEFKFFFNLILYFFCWALQDQDLLQATCSWLQIKTVVYRIAVTVCLSVSLQELDPLIKRLAK